MLDNVLLTWRRGPLVWGVAHIVPTRNVVAGFGPLSEDNRIKSPWDGWPKGALAFVGVLRHW